MESPKITTRRAPLEASIDAASRRVLNSRGRLRAKLFALGLGLFAATGFGCKISYSCFGKEVNGCNYDPTDPSDNNNNNDRDRYRYIPSDTD